MKNWLRTFHGWGIQWAATKWSAWALFVCAFADASILPLPTPMFFLTMTLLNISKAYRYALYATVGIFCGSIAGYALGHFAWLNSGGEFTALAQYMFKTVPGFTEELYSSMHLQFEKWDFGILFAGSFLPLPFNIFSISSGVFGINLFMFCFAIIIGQGFRFYLMALLVRKLGPGVKKLFNEKLKPISLIALACILAGILYSALI
jgi:membrane protein YqaA with SNARE-associated domain